MPGVLSRELCSALAELNEFFLPSTTYLQKRGGGSLLQTSFASDTASSTADDSAPSTSSTPFSSDDSTPSTSSSDDSSPATADPSSAPGTDASSADASSTDASSAATPAADTAQATDAAQATDTAQATDASSVPTATPAQNDKGTTGSVFDLMRVGRDAEAASIQDSKKSAHDFDAGMEDALHGDPYDPDAHENGNEAPSLSTVGETDGDASADPASSVIFGQSKASSATEDHDAATANKVAKAADEAENGGTIAGENPEEQLVEKIVDSSKFLADGPVPLVNHAAAKAGPIGVHADEDFAQVSTNHGFQGRGSNVGRSLADERAALQPPAAGEIEAAEEPETGTSGGKKAHGEVNTKAPEENSYGSAKSSSSSTHHNNDEQMKEGVVGPSTSSDEKRSHRRGATQDDNINFHNHKKNMNKQNRLHNNYRQRYYNPPMVPGVGLLPPIPLPPGIGVGRGQKWPPPGMGIDDPHPFGRHHHSGPPGRGGFEFDHHQPGLGHHPGGLGPLGPFGGQHHHQHPGEDFFDDNPPVGSPEYDPPPGEDNPSEIEQGKDNPSEAEPEITMVVDPAHPDQPPILLVHQPDSSSPQGGPPADLGSQLQMPPGARDESGMKDPLAPPEDQHPGPSTNPGTLIGTVLALGVHVYLGLYVFSRVFRGQLSGGGTEQEAAAAAVSGPAVCDHQGQEREEGEVQQEPVVGVQQGPVVASATSLSDNAATTRVDVEQSYSALVGSASSVEPTSPNGAEDREATAQAQVSSSSETEGEDSKGVEAGSTSASAGSGAASGAETASSSDQEIEAFGAAVLNMLPTSLISASSSSHENSARGSNTGSHRSRLLTELSSNSRLELSNINSRLPAQEPTSQELLTSQNTSQSTSSQQ